MTNLQEMSYEELLTESGAIASEIADIKAQLDIAKGEAASDGVYRDPVWFAKAKQALRHRGVEHQTILTEIGRRNKERKRQSSQSRAQAFMVATRELTDKETFDRIWNRSTEIMEE